MNDITFTQQHQLSHQDARQAAQKMAERMAGELDMETAWEGDVLRFDGSGLSGTLKVGASQADIEIKLGMLMQAFRPVIEAKIVKHMKIVFDDPV